MPLPSLPYTRSMFRPVVRTVFGGMNRNPNAGDGEIYDMENLTGRDYPLLSTRPLRTKMYSADQNIGSIGVLRGLGDYGDSKVLYFWTQNKAEENFAELHCQSFRNSITHYVVEGLELSQGQKQFAVMGMRVIIFPDKVMVTFSDTEITWEPLGADWTGLADFTDGTVYGVAAEGNTVRARAAAGLDFRELFRTGDAVELSFSDPAYTVNNKTAILRDVEETVLTFDEYSLDTWYPMTLTGQALGANTTGYFARNGRLYYFDTGSDAVSAANVLRLPGGEENENSLRVYDTAEATEPSREIELFHDAEEPDPGWTALDFLPDGTLTVTRAVPDLKGIMAQNNRLWGYAGNTIYASKLGDPRNFEYFDGTAEDSWVSEALSTELYSGCTVYQDYPTYFTESGVWRVYGDKPENYSIRQAGSMGVRLDSSRSIAEAGGSLFWLSPWGVCAWRGGDEPTVISEPLGASRRFVSGRAAGDGVRYYICMSYDTGDAVTHFRIYVYDTRRRFWHREDNTFAIEMLQDGGTVLWLKQHPSEVWSTLDLHDNIFWYWDEWPEGLEAADFPWMAEFGDSTRLYETTDTGSQNKKGLLRLLLRCELESGSRITPYVQYDSDGEWHELRTIEAPGAAPADETDETRETVEPDETRELRPVLDPIERQAIRDITLPEEDAELMALRAVAALKEGAVKYSFHVPLILRRCDHYRLKLEGTGPAKVYSITEEKYGGSWLQTK